MRSVEVVGSCLMGLGELVGGLVLDGEKTNDLDFFDDGVALGEPLSDDSADEEPDFSDD